MPLLRSTGALGCSTSGPFISVTTRVRSRQRRSLPSTSVMRLRLLSQPLLPPGPSSGPPSPPFLPLPPIGCARPHPSPFPRGYPRSRKNTPPPSSRVSLNRPGVPSFPKAPRRIYIHHCPFARESTPGGGRAPCPVVTDHSKIPKNGKIAIHPHSLPPSLLSRKFPTLGFIFCLLSCPGRSYPHTRGEVSVAWLHCSTAPAPQRFFHN